MTVDRGGHRCSGCPSCIRTVVAYVPTWGARSENLNQQERRTVVERQLQDLLRETPDDWYGGREITDPPLADGSRLNCPHKYTTKYMNGEFCRQCGNWLVKT